MSFSFSLPSTTALGRLKRALPFPSFMAIEKRKGDKW